MEGKQIGILAVVGIGGLAVWEWLKNRAQSQQCPAGQHWDATRNICVADSGGPPSTPTFSNFNASSNIG